MGKKNKQQNNQDKMVDLTMRFLEDSRISAKDIELFNLAQKDFPSAQIDDPITVYDSKLAALQTYNNYIKRTLDTPGLSEDQIKKCLSNSYVRYYTHILGLNSITKN